MRTTAELERGTGVGAPPEPPADVAAAPGFRFGRVAILLDLAFWTFFALLIALNRLAGPRRPTDSPQVVQETIYWFFESYLWAAATPVIFWLTWRLIVAGDRRLARGLALVAAGLVLSALLNVLGEVISERVLDLPRFRPRGSSPNLLLQPWLLLASPRVLNDLVTFGGVVAAGFASEYFRRYRQREAEAARLHAQLAEARLAMLRAQLNPHFLFNTLNAVSTLVASDPRGVRRMIARLSELLRYTLEGAHEQEIPLAQELQLTRRYLEILEIRYEGRLETRVEITSELEGALVPNLILQPLAENALTHGVARAGGRGRIEVTARREGDRLLLAVRDTGPGDVNPGATEPSAEVVGHGMGLRNTRERLRELYGQQQSLELRPTPDGGMIAEIAMPFRTPAAPAGPDDPSPLSEVS
jgi:two-component system, LytTR family, sensor kinase